MPKLDRPYLGELETAVMEALWRCGSADAKSMHGSLGQQRGIALSTIQSTLERLYRKGLLRREKVSHAYLYSPAIERSALLGQVFEALVENLAKDQTNLALAAFVDFASRADASTLDELERLIAQRRAHQGDTGK